MVNGLGTCSFHNAIPARTGCTRCHRLLCSEDSWIIKVNRASGIGKTKQNYCPICYVKTLQEREVKAWFALGIFLILSLVLPFIFKGTTMIIYEIGILLTTAFMVIVVFMNRMQSLKGEKRVNSFLTSLKTKPGTFSGITYGNQSTDFYFNVNLPGQNQKNICAQCGQQLVQNDLFCPNCGTSTKEKAHSLE